MPTGTLLDHSVGIGTETTFGTGVTVNRFGEWTPGNSMDFDPKVAETQGLRQGSRFNRSGRRVPVIGQGSGSIQMDYLSKGMGLWLQPALGTSASTLVSGTTYQQNHTPVLPNATTLKSVTLQEGIVEAQGNIDAYTYAGCTFKALELGCSSSAPLLYAKFDVDAKGLATATAYATPAYTGQNTATVFNFANLVVTLGGTLTEPTTTTLASVASGVTLNVRGITINIDNAIDDGRWVPGSRNQPTSGDGSIKVKIDVEYDSVTGTLLRDAQLNQTNVGPLIATWTGAALSSGNETLQFVAATCLINSGAIPQVSDDKTIVTSIEFEVENNLTSSQVAWLVARTADTAL